MADSKLVKSLIDAATITGLVAGIGWVAKKALKMSFTADPSNSFENYAKFTATMAGAVALKDYLVDQKIIPSSM